MCLSHVWYLSFGHRYHDIVSMNDDERRNFLSSHGGQHCSIIIGDEIICQVATPK